MTDARMTDGPSRPVGLELAIGGGILVAALAVIGFVAVGQLGALTIPYVLLAFLPGLVAWVPLLLVARRLTGERPVAARVLASALAALVAIVVDFAVVMLVIAPLAGYWDLYVVFALVASIVFVVGALIAAFIVHLGADAARRSRDRG